MNRTVEEHKRKIVETKLALEGNISKRRRHDLQVYLKRLRKDLMEYEQRAMAK